MPFNIGGQLLTSSMLGPSGQILSKTFTPVSASMVDSYEAPFVTITSSGNDANGMYQLTGYAQSGGCGNPNESGIWVKIKNTIPWTYVVCKFTVAGTASCWSFNNSGYGSFTDRSGNLYSYSSAAGDIIYRSNAINCFENTAYTVQPGACDNDASNFFRFAGTKSFYMLSRRNTSNNNVAGPIHGRSCNEVSGGATMTISEIYIF